MEKNVMAYGINTELKMIMDFAKFVSKKNKIKILEFKKTLTLINCLIVMVYVKRKI